ncbi:MAG: alpha/beta fold hydrolase [Actinomycetota bacterium]
MDAPSFTTVTNGEVELQVAVTGDGPLILCVHGWPELWYSWRHQMAHFADRGFRVAAMDVRGYGGSSAPAEVEAYTIRELSSDAAAVVEALSDEPAILFGHDWGAPIVWNTARFHADTVRAVAGLSVPYRPIGPDSALDLWRALYTAQGRFFYQIYFDDNPGTAEAELGADTLRSLRMIYYAASGDARRADAPGLTANRPHAATMLEGLVDPDPFPAWHSAEDLQVYAAGIDRSGWHGPLNRYRAQTLDAEQLGSVTDPDGSIMQPATFIGGEHDPVRSFADGFDLFELAGDFLTDHRGTTIVDGAGHWVQNEAPEAVNAALAMFVDGLD